MLSFKWKSCITAITLTVVSLTASKSVLATSLYSITDLGALTGEASTFAEDINDSGEVIINSFTDSFFYSNGLIKKISPLPGDNQLAVTGINNLGQVIGDSLGRNKFNLSYPFL